MNNPSTITEKDLKPGDVLLSAGTDALDQLILELSNGIYSHAAFWDGQNVIEATETGIRSDTLKFEVDAQTYVDAYRFVSADGHHLGDTDWPIAPLNTVAQSYIGQPYAYGDAVLLALLLIASKGRTYTTLELLAIDALFIEATKLLDTWLNEGTRSATCSELVYKIFKEAQPPKYGLKVQDALGGNVNLEVHGSSVIDAMAKEVKASAQAFLKAYLKHTGTQEDVIIPGLVTPKNLQDSTSLTLIGRLEKK
jgi:hypothetical protein